MLGKRDSSCTWMIMFGLVEVLVVLINVPSIWSDLYSSQNQYSLFDKTTLIKADSVVVYVHVLTDSNFNDSVERAVFFPLVDDFSQLTIPQTADIFRNESEVYVYVNVSGGHVSPLRFYKDIATPDYFVGYFTAVINIDNGNITSVYWIDDLCNECYSSECVNQTNCGISYSDANNCQVNNTADGTNTDGQLCNIVVYLAWVGTDANGTPMTSLSYTPSNFQAYSAFPVYKAAAGIATDRLV